MTDTDLKRRQEAGELVEHKMRTCLLAFTPVYELKLSDVLYIARLARAIAFDAFDPNRGKA